MRSGNNRRKFAKTSATMLRSASWLTLLATGAPALAAVWSGGSGNWNAVGTPGWDALPNGVGAVASKTDDTTATVTQNIAAGVIVGTVSYSGQTAKSFSITPTNTLTLNQDNAGVGRAQISNVGSAVGAYRVALGTGSVTLADDLLVSNTSGSTNSAGSISITSTISGSGDVTIRNDSNDIAAGQIVFSANNASTFTGDILIQKGAVTYATNAPFGHAANLITLGQSGEGSASLVSTATSGTMSNRIIVAATAGRESRLLGSTASANKYTYANTVRLDGDVTVTSSAVGEISGVTNAVIFSGAISGVGSLSTAGTGRLRLAAVNSYSGNTSVGNLSTLELADDAALTFVIGASGQSNRISGGGTLLLNGDFIFDLTAAASAGSWTIVDATALTETYGASFSVVGFTPSGDVWTRTVGATTYTFEEQTGVLTAVVPEPAGAGVLVAAALLLRTRRRR